MKEVTLIIFFTAFLIVERAIDYKRGKNAEKSAEILKEIENLKTEQKLSEERKVRCEAEKAKEERILAEIQERMLKEKQTLIDSMKEMVPEEKKQFLDFAECKREKEEIEAELVRIRNAFCMQNVFYQQWQSVNSLPNALSWWK